MPKHFWWPVRALGSAAAAATAVVAIVMTIGAPGPSSSPVSAHHDNVPVGQSPASSGGPSERTIIRPPLVIVLGDSTAGTISSALGATEPPGTTVVDRGTFGCGLATGTWASDIPPTPQMPMFSACNQAEPASRQWPSLEAASVQNTAPGDVVLFVAGNWECEDILRDGRWSNITQPSFQLYLLAQMELAVRIGTARGAQFDFTTMAAMANGTVGDAPIRRRIYNHLLEIVASKSPSAVSLIDLGDILSPGGVFAEYLDGVQVRTPDGIHTPAYAPGNVFVNNSSEAVAEAFDHWLSPRLWPLIFGSDHSDAGHSSKAQ